MSSHPDIAPRFSEPQNRHTNDFRVEMPQSSSVHSNTADAPFSNSASKDSTADNHLKLDLQGSAEIYGAQKSKAGKASANE